MNRVCIISEEPLVSLEEPIHRGGGIFLHYAARYADAFVITGRAARGPLSRLVNSVGLFLKAFFALKKEKPRVVLAKTSGAYLPAFLACKILGIKCKIHVGSFPKYKYAKLFLLKLPYDEIITTGEHLKREIEEYASARVRVVGNGIDFTLFSPRDKNSCRQKLNLPLGKFLILFAGGFEEVKRLPFMLDIFKDFQRAHSESVLVMVGEGSQKENIKKRAKNLGLEDGVIFRDAVSHEQLNKYYNAANVFLLTSSSEGGSPPRTILEAMACNTPPISVKQGDSRYLQNLGVKVAFSKDEYLAELEEVFSGGDNINLREKIKDFDIKKNIKDIFT